MQGENRKASHNLESTSFFIPYCMAEQEVPQFSRFSYFTKLIRLGSEGKETKMIPIWQKIQKEKDPILETSLSKFFFVPSL